MLKVENVETYGWEAAIRGMRNPLNSWEKSDSYFYEDGEYHDIKGTCGPSYKDTSEMELGENDIQLMKNLSKGGPVHAKFRRMLTITMDITAPLYWWKEFDTYKVGTVANSCSTMHKIHAKEFELDDFSHEHLNYFTESLLHSIINELNVYRTYFVNFDQIDSGELYGMGIKNKKDAWWQMIQLLPSSYNQKRTVQLNYEVAHNIYISRKDHKLDEWHTLCDALEELPMSELITGGWPKEEC